MPATIAFERGNLVQYKGGKSEAIVLAIRKDGSRMKVHVHGRDQEFVWVPTTAFIPTITGDEKCWKCNGSGRFYGGGIVENGVYKGYSGDCYACSGKGTQNNADRIRNHYYWHRGVTEGRDTIEDRPVQPASERVPASPTPVPTPVKATVKPAATSPRAEQTSMDTSNTRRRAATLIDCAMCNTLHRTDVPCPWGEGRTD